MYHSGPSIAKRRSILGNKNHGFKITPLIEVNSEIVNFCYAYMRKDIYVMTQIQENSITKKKVYTLTRTKVVNGEIRKVVKEIPVEILSLFVIHETDRFFAIDTRFYLYYITTDADLVKISTDVTALNTWAVRPFIYNNSIYILLLDGKMTPHLHLYKFTNQNKELVCDMQLQIKPFLAFNNEINQLKNEEITAVVPVVIKDQLYIFATNKNVGMFAEYNIKTQMDIIIFRSFYQKPKIDGVTIFPFIESNNKQLCILNQLGINIFNLNDIIGGRTVPSPITIYDSVIMDAMGLEKIILLYRNNTYPFFMTDKHIVLFITKDMHGKYHNPAMVLFSIASCRLSSKIFLADMKITSFNAAPDLNSFIVTGNYGAIKVDYTNEVDNTRSHTIDEMIHATKPNVFISAAEIVVKSLMDKRFKDSTQKLNEIVHSKKNVSEDQILLSHILMNELMMIDTGTKFKQSFNPPKIDKEMAKKYEKFLDYIKFLRAFSPAIENTVSQNNQTDNESSIIKTDIAKYAIEHPNELFDKISVLPYQQKWEILPSIVAFFDNSLDNEKVFNLLKEALKEGLWEHAHLLMMTIINKGVNLEHYDEEFGKLFSNQHPLFKYFPILRIQLVKANMLKTLESLSSLSEKFIEKKENLTSPDNKGISRNEIHTQIDGFLNNVNSLKAHIDQCGKMMEQELLSPPSNIQTNFCSVCDKPLGDSGIVFECGHGFHEKCLIEKLKPLLSSQDLYDLNQYEYARSPENLALREDIILQDCPLCGEIALGYISIPIVDSKSPTNFPIL